MGGCLSKKSTSASSPNALPKPSEEIKSDTQVEEKEVEGGTVKKEIFIIKHRKSHEIERGFEDEESKAKEGELVNSYEIPGAAPVRTSSCTKEELDAILIQCGRLSRSSSTGKAAISGSGGLSKKGVSNLQKGRKNIGSKRSFDFNNESGRERRSTDEKNVVNGDDGPEMVGERESRHRRRPSQVAEAGSSSQEGGRRRTPGRERGQAEQKPRSSSRERGGGGGGGGGGGRRVSRSPGRRSESPNSSSANANVDRGSRPSKMVSVPATVSSLAMDKSNNAAAGEPNSTTAVKRIQVKRTVGADGAASSRTGASPRAQSPARANARVCNEIQNTNLGQNQQLPVSLSRSNSRKAEHSPYRRNPLSEIDTNVIVEHIPSSPGIKTKNNILSQAPLQKRNADNNRVVQGGKKKPDNSLTNVNCKGKEKPQLMAEETTGAYVVLNVVTSGTEHLKPLVRTRSRSRDLDIKLEELSDPTPSYTALLLEDIHNFHQTNNTPPAFSLPPCLTKACSILEAVADLNSTTSSNLPCTFSDERRRYPLSKQSTKHDSRDPYVESEVAVYDDLMEPSFQKYTTGRRSNSEQQESSGSNSFISSLRLRDPSAWEPNSADSTDDWTSSRSNKLAD